MSNFIKSLEWSPASLKTDLSASLTVALVSIPEGMAYAMVAGVNPVYGLYTGMVTTLVAALTSSTSLLVVTLTNALALVTADKLKVLSPDMDPVRAMFTLTMLTGLIMFILGVFKLGSVIRFVSREVMSGFIFATALLIVLGQYKDLVGYSSQLDANKLVKAIDITLHIQDWNFQAAILGAASIIFLLVMKRTALKRFADILGILFTTAMVMLLQWGNVELVGDIAAIPSGLSALPKPVLPDFSAIPLLLTGAIAAAVVGLAESSGVGSAFPNPDGKKSNMSRDFTAQGLGNLFGSIFQAMPAGGSLSRTGVNKSGGAQTRWAGIYSAVLLAVIVVLFGAYAMLIPMCGLAALLIVIGFEVMIKEGKELTEAWQISRMNVSIAMITIIVGIFADLTSAIFTGVILSLLAFAAVSGIKFEIKQWIRDARGAWLEKPYLKEPMVNQAIILEIVGNWNFALVYSLDELLPEPEKLKNSVVVLHSRDRVATSLTGIEWAREYARNMKLNGNQVMMSGVNPEMMEKFKNLGIIKSLGEENIFIEQPEFGAAMKKALDAANRWIEANQEA